MPIQIAPADVNLSVQMPLPAANNNNTSPVLDLQAIAPNSSAWQLGRIKVTIPALPENTAGTGITLAIQAAPVSLTSGVKAPALPPPGAFVTPNPSQTVTVAAVANGGSLAAVYYFNLPTDGNGSTYQFIQFVQTVPAGVVTQGEVINYQFVSEYGN
jgi:hypothetical protein